MVPNSESPVAGPEAPGARSRRWDPPSSGGRFGGLGRSGWLFVGSVALYLLLFAAFRGLPLFTAPVEAPPVVPDVTLDGGAPAPGTGGDGAPVPSAAPASLRAVQPAAVPAPAPSPLPAVTPPPSLAKGPGAPALANPAPASSSPAPADAPATGDGEGRAALFDLAVTTKRVVYLLDVSGSMQEPASPQGGRSRFEVSTEEIRRSIRGLPPQVSFNVVLFADGAVSLSPDPLPATPEAKRRAEAFLSKLPDMGGSTRFVAGIHEALRNGGDTLFLTTDGGLNEPEWKVIEKVQDEMASQAVKPRIYTFGMTAGPMEDGTDRLFEKLCMMYGGRYQPMREWQAAQATGQTQTLGQGN